MYNTGHRMYADFTDKAWEAMENGKTMFNNGFRSNEGSFFPEQPVFTEIVEPEETEEALGNMVNAKNIGIAATAIAVIYGISKRKEIKEWVTDKAVPGIKKALNISGEDKEGSGSGQTSCSNKDTESNTRKPQGHQADVIDFKAYSESKNRAGVEKAN